MFWAYPKVATMTAVRTTGRILSAMLCRCLVALLVWTSAAVAELSAIRVADPESVGMSSERLGRVETWLDGMVERKEAAGFVSLVARRGKVVHHRATGTRGMSVSEAMPLDALFDVASMTKPLTAVAALMLYEEGRISLSGPVAAHLPEFGDRQVAARRGKPVPARREMSVRHLFTHTSGVNDPRGRAETYAFPTMASYMKDFVQLPLQAEPGTRWIYGDSLDVLGFLVERVSGEGLDSFLQQRLLDPLGMADTHYWPPEAKQSRRAMLVVNGEDDPTRESREPPEAGQAKTFVSGASGLHTTAADYWRFCQMLLNGGEFRGTRLLGPRSVTLMSEDHLEEGTPYRAGLGFGLGVAVVLDRARSGWPYSPGSYYWGGSQGTVFWIDPAEELVGVLMVQVRPARGLYLRERFAALVYSSIVD